MFDKNLDTLTISTTDLDEGRTPRTAQRPRTADVALDHLRRAHSCAMSYVGETIHYTSNRAANRLTCWIIDPIVERVGRLAYLVALQCDITADRCARAPQGRSTADGSRRICSRHCSRTAKSREHRAVGYRDRRGTEPPWSAPRGGRCLGAAIQSLERCGEVINSILSVSCNEVSGKLVCDLAVLARDAKNSVSDYAAERSASIELDVPADLPSLHVNAPQMQMALVILLRNAIEAGSSTVTIRGSQRGAKIELTVQDDGCGIGTKQSRHGFEPLYAKRSHDDGVWIGLSLCSRILEAHGGAIAIDNQPGRGAVVTITLPTLK